MSESFAYAACMTRKALLSLSRQILTQAMHIRVPIQNFSFESTARSAQEDSVVPISCCPTKQIIIMRIRWDLAAAAALHPPLLSAHLCVDAKIFESYPRCGFRGDALEGSEWACPSGMFLGLMYRGSPRASEWDTPSANCPTPDAKAGGSWLVHGRWSCWWLGFWLLWCWLGI